MISWFPALFGTQRVLRRFESLLSDNKKYKVQNI